jgi:hypothetical protein
MPPVIVNDRPILSSEPRLYRDYNRKCSVEKKNTGRGSLGAWRHDELIGGKPPVVKTLTDSDYESVERESAGSQLRAAVAEARDSSGTQRKKNVRRYQATASED